MGTAFEMDPSPHITTLTMEAAHRLSRQQKLYLMDTGNHWEPDRTALTRIQYILLDSFRFQKLT